MFNIIYSYLIILLSFAHSDAILELYKLCPMAGFDSRRVERSIYVTRVQTLGVQLKPERLDATLDFQVNTALECREVGGSGVAEKSGWGGILACAKHL